jgi:hypothetical protein
MGAMKSASFEMLYRLNEYQIGGEYATRVDLEGP